MVNLLRNGGFERGDVEFWELDIGSLFAVSEVQKKRGTYSGKIVSDAGGNAIIRTKDLIKVKEGDVLHVGGYIYADAASTAYIYIVFKDSKGNTIESVYATKSLVGGLWEIVEDYLLTNQNVSYITLKIGATGLTGNTAQYFDAVFAEVMNKPTIAVEKKLLFDIENATTKETVLGETIFTGLMHHAEYFLNATKLQRVADGADVTLDVKIESLDPETNVWRDAMVFQQLATTDNDPVTTVEYKSLESNLGWKQRGSYTLAGAGTVEDCDFTLGVVYKR